MAARQCGHCSSAAVAIGSTAPHAPHRETVCLASIPPPRGASPAGGGGCRGSAPGFRYPCWRYLRSDMGVILSGLRPLLRSIRLFAEDVVPAMTPIARTAGAHAAARGRAAKSTAVVLPPLTSTPTRSLGAGT